MKKVLHILTISCLLVSSLGNVTAYADVTTSVNPVPIVSAKKSDFENIAVSQVTGYVNIRENATTSSMILGKIYNNCAATILSTVEGEGGTWYKIKSGTVEGYIKAEYFVTGEQAEDLAQKVGKEFAAINTESLRLREKPDLTSNTLTLLSQGARYVVLEESGDFFKVAVDNDLEGYVAKQYCTTTIEFEQALSLAEERQLLEDEAQRKWEATRAIAALEEVKQVEAKKEGTSSELVIDKNPEQSDNSQKTTAPKPATGGTAAPNSTAVVSATRTAIVAYAKQFLGNPYVYGGTSLTNGADCSGFTQAIYANFGIKTGRTSRDQADNGRAIAVSAVQPGDLLFYASGDYINHVALYIGNGQVIHASNSTTGIIISPYNYRTPYKATTFLD